MIATACPIRNTANLRGRIRGIALEWMKQGVDLTIFVADLGFDDFRELAGSELSFIKKG
jgi:hypothetical protein